MSMRITVACPQALIPAANHLAMVLGYSGADAQTYGSADWRDSEGNLYALASFPVSDEWIGGAQSGLARPAWDTSLKIDMSAAQIAQASLVFWCALTDEGAAPQASPGALVALGGVEPLEAISALGVRRT